ncbi:MAG: sigma-70 family RNA polymerase sigma factor [Pseudomonadota bacterium]
MPEKTKPHAQLVQLLPSLRRRARRLARSPVDAEDIVQDTLLNLCARLSSGGQIDDLRAYAMRSLTHRARRDWGKSDPQAYEDDMLITGDATQHLNCTETLRAIDDLPAPQRRVMRHLVAGETSPGAIARATGLPVGTVMSRLARARARLRDALGESD